VRQGGFEPNGDSRFSRNFADAKSVSKSTGISDRLIAVIPLQRNRTQGPLIKERVEQLSDQFHQITTIPQKNLPLGGSPAEDGRQTAAILIVGKQPLSALWNGFSFRMVNEHWKSECV